MTWLIINFHKCVPTYLKVDEKNKFNITYVPRRTVMLIACYSRSYLTEMS